MLQTKKALNNEREIFMNNLKIAIQEILTEKVSLSTRAGAPIVKTTQRGDWKKKIENALVLDLQDTLAEIEQFVIAGKSADGVVMSFEHPDMLENEFSEIPVQFEVKMKNLDYETENEIDAYEFEQLEKERIKAEKEKAKAEKIKRDTVRYAKIKAEKEALEKEALEKLTKATE